MAGDSGDALLDAAKKAIGAIFSDTSVPRSETKERLGDLSSDIDTMLDALENDEENDSGGGS